MLIFRDSAGYVYFKGGMVMIRIGTVSTPVELEMLKELYEENGIEIFPHHREAGEFLTLYMGTSNYGIDIMVAEEHEEEAQRLFTLYFSDIPLIDEASLIEQAEAATREDKESDDE